MEWGEWIEWEMSMLEWGMEKRKEWLYGKGEVGRVTQTAWGWKTRRPEYSEKSDRVCS